MADRRGVTGRAAADAGVALDLCGRGEGQEDLPQKNATAAA